MFDYGSKSQDLDGQPKKVCKVLKNLLLRLLSFYFSPLLYAYILGLHVLNVKDGSWSCGLNTMCYMVNCWKFCCKSLHSRFFADTILPSLYLKIVFDTLLVGIYIFLLIKDNT